MIEWPTALCSPAGAQTVQFSQSSYTAYQTSSSVTITVNVSPPSSQPVTVNYSTSDGTARSPAETGS